MIAVANVMKLMNPKKISLLRPSNSQYNIRFLTLPFELRNTNLFLTSLAYPAAAFSSEAIDSNAKHPRQSSERNIIP
jgi:hypothetical protein